MSTDTMGRIREIRAQVADLLDEYRRASDPLVALQKETKPKLNALKSHMENLLMDLEELTGRAKYSDDFGYVTLVKPRVVVSYNVEMLEGLLERYPELAAARTEKERAGYVQVGWRGRN